MARRIEIYEHWVLRRIYRIHDLRHTFAGWFEMKVVPFFDVSKLLLDANIQMTERYAHLASDYLHDGVVNLDFSVRFQHTEKLKRQCSTRIA